MQYDFDERVQREHTACFKYDWREGIFGKKDVLPMWVADMDLKTPPFVIEALKKRLEHEILGYSFRPEGFYESIINWNEKRNQWKVKKDWISYSPGVVPALNLMVMAYTNPGDKVIVQTPVYFPFFTAVTHHKRTLIINPLQLNNGRYEMDYEHLESLMDDDVRLFILCSPHNPTGNVWKKHELERLSEICLKNNTIIIADEIHSDLTFPGHKHIPLASVSEEIADQTITCMAPSKTFNLAGLATSFVISSNKKLLRKYDRVLEHVHVGMGNVFGHVALESAYNHGGEWLNELMHYLKQNVDYMHQFLKSNIPEVNMVIPEGTYLVWLDFRNWKLSDNDLKNFMVHEAGLGLSDGPMFGKNGSGFQRMNIACPKSQLKKALEQLYQAYKKRFSK